MKGFLRVKLWDDEIGVLMWDKQRKKSYFIYNPKFLKKRIGGGSVGCINIGHS